MPEVVRSALLAVPAARVFALVDDVASYPGFLPWCSRAVELSRTDDEVVASLEVSRAGFVQAFTTRNQRRFPDRIGLELVDGPFERLQGEWRFIALGGDAGCKVELRLAFEMKRSLLNLPFGAAFEHIANTLVDAFCKRAREVCT